MHTVRDVARGVLERHGACRVVTNLGRFQESKHLHWHVGSGERVSNPQGLRPVEVWIPDVTSPAFIEEARRQSLRIANSPGEAEDQAFVDSISTLDE